MARAHASLAGLKSLSTTIAAEGIEDCRRCCGGHGYLVRAASPPPLLVALADEGARQGRASIDRSTQGGNQRTPKHTRRRPRASRS